MVHPVSADAPRPLHPPRTPTAPAATLVQLKRAYTPAAADDGTRVLVDRLWPRGVSKDHAAVDLWMKDLAPSTALRQWFNHDPARWAGFQARYAAEVLQQPALFQQLRGLAQQGRITLVYAARDTDHNEAVVLRNLLLD